MEVRKDWFSVKVAKSVWATVLHPFNCMLNFNPHPDADPTPRLYPSLKEIIREEWASRGWLETRDSEEIASFNAAGHYE